jgi:hypothetical protein
MKALAVVTVLVLACGSAAADILQWQDTDGVKHYTNLAQEVPAEYRHTARVVVDETVRGPRALPAAEPAPVVSESGPPRMAQVVYDRSPVEQAYIDGLTHGLALRQASGDRRDAGVRIRGPLAVANATATAPTVRRGYLPWYHYPYPLVTTSFDRGRSRHLTLRMLMQDQLALERDWLYGFETRHGARRMRPRLSLDIDRRVLRVWRREAAKAARDR